MKIFVIFCLFTLLLLGYKTFNDNDSDPLSDEELELALKSQTLEGKKLQDSFKQILPEMKQAQLFNRRTAAERGPYFSQETTGAEAIQKIEGEFKADPERGSRFLQYSLFESDLPLEAKEEILANARDFIPPNLFQHVLMTMLNQQVDPALYDEAIKVYLESLPAKEVPYFFQELSSRTAPGPHLDILRQEASARDIDIP